MFDFLDLFYFSCNRYYGIFLYCIFFFYLFSFVSFFFFFFQAEDGIRDGTVTGVQTCALPISGGRVVAVAVGRGVGPVGQPGELPERVLGPGGRVPDDDLAVAARRLDGVGRDRDARDGRREAVALARRIAAVVAREVARHPDRLEGCRAVELVDGDGVLVGVR